MADKKKCVRSPDSQAGEGGEPSSPVFKSLGSAFGLALGELALALGSNGDVEFALRQAELSAKAALLAGGSRDYKVC